MGSEEGHSISQDFFPTSAKSSISKAGSSRQRYRLVEVTWRPARAIGVAPARTGRYRLHYHPPLVSVGGSALSTHDWSIWIQIWPFEYEFDSFKKNPKILNFVPPPYKYPQWFELISHPFHHICTLLFTHTMSSSNSSKMEDQLTMVF
jgi:hypothetical protein